MDKLIKCEMKKLVARNHKVFDLWDVRDDLVEKFEARQRGDRHDEATVVEQERQKLAETLRELEQLRKVKFHPILSKTYGWEVIREELRSKNFIYDAKS